VAGYSPTPLLRKLGLQPGVPAAVIGAPMDYGTLLEIAEAPAVLFPGDPIPEGLAFLHLFTLHRAEMAKVLTAARNRIARDGMIWVSWPKKAARVPTDITEDGIREVCLPMGYVDVKVCAVTEVWSGLKLVIRKELR
jgi:hypothetical protein